MGSLKRKEPDSPWMRGLHPDDREKPVPWFSNILARSAALGSFWVLDFCFPWNGGEKLAKAYSSMYLDWSYFRPVYTRKRQYYGTEVLTVGMTVRSVWHFGSEFCEATIRAICADEKDARNFMSEEMVYHRQLTYFADRSFPASITVQVLPVQDQEPFENMHEGSPFGLPELFAEVLKYLDVPQQQILKSVCSWWRQNIDTSSYWDPRMLLDVTKLPKPVVLISAGLPDAFQRPLDNHRKTLLVVAPSRGRFTLPWSLGLWTPMLTQLAVIRLSSLDVRGGLLTEIFHHGPSIRLEARKVTLRSIFDNVSAHFFLERQTFSESDAVLSGFTTFRTDCKPYFFAKIGQTLKNRSNFQMVSEFCVPNDSINHGGNSLLVDTLMYIVNNCQPELARRIKSDTPDNLAESRAFVLQGPFTPVPIVREALLSSYEGERYVCQNVNCCTVCETCRMKVSRTFHACPDHRRGMIRDGWSMRFVDAESLKCGGWVSKPVYKAPHDEDGVTYTN